MDVKKTPFTNEEIAIALHDAHGLTSVAADILSKTKRPISRQAIEKRISKSEALKEIMHQEVESLTDLAEHKLFELINRGDKTAIIFYLKCKGKARGYVERQEVTGADGAPIEPVKIQFI